MRIQRQAFCVLGLIVSIMLLSTRAFAQDDFPEPESESVTECTNAHPPTGPFYSGRATQRRPRPAGPLRIVSYNVNFATEMADLMRDLTELAPLKDADLILLQEIEGEPSGTLNAAQQFAERLQMHYVFAPAIVRGKSGRDYGNAILSRWPIERFRKIMLPPSGLETCNQRIALQATVRIDDKPIEVFSVHLSVLFTDSAGRELSRAKQVLPVLEETAKIDPKTPVIIAGDLNTVNSSGWRALSDLFLKQGFNNAHFVARTTTFKIAPFHLDHMFARNLCAVERGVARQAKGSDHYPIWSNLVLETSEHPCAPLPERTGD